MRIKLVAIRYCQKIRERLQPKTNPIAECRTPKESQSSNDELVVRLRNSGFVIRHSDSREGFIRGVRRTDNAVPRRPLQGWRPFAQFPPAPIRRTAAASDARPP